MDFYLGYNYLVKLSVKILLDIRMPQGQKTEHSLGKTVEESHIKLNFDP